VFLLELWLSNIVKSHTVEKRYTKKLTINQPDSRRKKSVFIPFCDGLKLQSHKAKINPVSASMQACVY